MLIRDFLTTRVFSPTEATYMPLVPLVPFAFVLDRDGTPQRIVSQTRVEVPLGNWDPRREDDLLAKLLVQVAENSLSRRAQNYAAVNPQLWAKMTYNLSGLLLNPDHRDKFEVPSSSTVFFSNEVPLNRIVCLGAPSRVGTFVIKGALRGFYVPHGPGVTSVLLYEAV